MTLKSLLISAAVAAGALAATTGSASAYVVCNRDGDCWHTERRVSVPGFRFDFHPDDWYFHQRWDNDRRWRDYHRERGYWRGGVWITL